MRTIEVDHPAASRSRFYALLAVALRSPSDAFHSRLVGGSFARGLAEALAGLPFEVTEPSLEAVDMPVRGELARSYAEHFEVGGPEGPPCLLYEAEYGGGRLKVMEDVLRFYDHFGVEPAADDAWHDRPDHVATEVEFMHFLAFREAETMAAGDDPRPYRDAQRDFLRFHLRDVVVGVARLVGPRAVPVYAPLYALLDEVTRRDLEQMQEAT